MRLGIGLSIAQPQGGAASNAITAPAATFSTPNITITATTNFDLSDGRFGASISVNGAAAVWYDGAGAAASQSLVLSLTDIGAVAGDLIGIDPGYSLTDPAVDKVYASTSGLYITPSIVTPTITGVSNPPTVAETATGVNGTALTRLSATRSVLWLGDGSSLGDTDNSHALTSDEGLAITFRNTTSDGGSATSAATADVIATGPTYHTITLVNALDILTPDYGAHAFPAATAGNLLVAFAGNLDTAAADGSNTPSDNISGTTGWTLVQDHQTAGSVSIGGGSYARNQVWTKVAVGGEATITWSGAANNYKIFGVIEFSKAGGSWSVDGTPAGNDGTTAGGGTWGAGSITLAGDKSAIVTFYHGNRAADSTAAPYDTGVVSISSGGTFGRASYNIYSTSGAKDVSAIWVQGNATVWIATAVGIKASS